MLSTWHSDGPLLTQEGLTGHWWDADTRHVGSSHLELVLPVLLQVTNLEGHEGDMKIELLFLSVEKVIGAIEMIYQAQLTL